MNSDGLDGGRGGERILIVAEHLSRRYGAKLALDDVSFNIAAGEIVGLLGLNGAGKTTTMNIITGYISSTTGRVAIGGHDIVDEPREAKRLIGYLPESLAFYTDMRVREYLDFIYKLKSAGLEKARDWKRRAGPSHEGGSEPPGEDNQYQCEDRAGHISGICKKVGIEDVTGRMIRNLSKGYRQRVGLAQSLIGDPRVLVLDEPTVGLDPSQVIEVRALIKAIGKNSTVIISSHILTEIQAICSRALVLNKGKLIADLPLSDNPSGGHSNGRSDKRTLEEIFLELVQGGVRV